MAKYQRYVYYIYNYEMGEKRANIGFLRVEVRNGTCKMTIQIRALSQGSPLKILLFKRGEEHLRCCEIGQLSMVNGMGSTSLSYTLQELSDMYYALEDIAGMILFADKDKFYATTWDDEGIEIDKMVIEETGNREKEEITHEKKTVSHEKETAYRKIEAVSHEREAVNHEKKTASHEMEAVNHEIETANHEMGAVNHGIETANHEIGAVNHEIETGEHEQEVENHKKETVTHEIEAKSDEKEADAQGDIPDTNAGAMPDIPADSARADLEATGFDESNFVEISPSCAAKILSSYPKMYPFESDNVIDCVRIELQDLHELPIEYWAMAHNSFLLQGYYSYLHLLFAQIQNENKEKSYVIGIPGICHVKQNYLAGRFGFRHFLPLRQTDDINGEFGYWLLEVSKRSV